MALAKCIECGKEISTEARSCPNCGKSNPTKNSNRPRIAAITVVAFFGIYAIANLFNPRMSSDPSVNPDSLALARALAFAKAGDFSSMTAAQLGNSITALLLSHSRDPAVPAWIDSAQAVWGQRFYEQDGEDVLRRAARECPEVSGSRERVRAAMVNTPGWSLVPSSTILPTLLAIACRSISIGMTPSEVRASWGEPDHINSTIRVSGRHEQWVYGHRSYVYFDNDRVTAIQN